MSRLHHRSVLLSRVAVTGIFLAVLAGCGDTTTNDTATPASDASAVAAGSAAAGSAAALAVGQLYQGGSPVAWQPQDRSGLPQHDGPSFAALVTLANADPENPGTPTVQNTNVDAAATVDPSLAGARGRFTFASDRLDPTGGTLPTGWFHIALDFSSQSTSFSVTNDDNGKATITGGQMAVYVHDVAVVYDPTSPGNWTRTSDVYTLVPGTTPLVVSVVANDGSIRTARITGQRHVAQVVTRDRGVTQAATITRRQVTTVDGDMSGLIAAIATPLQVQSGPILAKTSGGATAPFTQWSQASTVGGDPVTHTLLWNRFATLTITAQRPVAIVPFLWTITPSGESQATYITRDGVQTGPLTRDDFRTKFNVIQDLTKFAQHW